MLLSLILILGIVLPFILPTILMDYTAESKTKIIKWIINMVVLFGVEWLILLGILDHLFSLHAEMFFVCVLIFGVAFEILFTLLLWKRKMLVLKILMMLLMIGSVSTYVGIIAHQAYVDGLPTVSESESILNQYIPFSEGTKAVTLEEESTLKMEEYLPVLNGATALYPVYASFVQNTYPDYDPSGENYYPRGDSIVCCDTTTKAYEYLIEGWMDMIFVAEPSLMQLAAAKDKGVELDMTPIGKEAFVFFVNKDNPIDSLTLEQIQGIYNGTYTNWKELGGKNQSIKAFQRDEGSGSQTALQRIMGGQNMIDPIMTEEVSGMGGIIRKVGDYTNYSNAIGFSFRFYSTEMVENDEIKLLKINGVEPTEENIRNGTYPIASYFYAVTAGSENPNIKPFLDWILSEQGQEIIEKVGYTPLQ